MCEKENEYQIILDVLTWLSESRSVVSDFLRPHGLYSTWNSPGQNTWVGSLSLLQEIIPNQGSNTGLRHCGWILYQLSHKGSPRILEWVAYPFSSRCSRPKNWTGVSCTAGGFFTNSYQGRLDMTKTLSNCQLMIGWSLRNTECFITWLKPLLIIKHSMFLEDHPIINWQVCGRIN